MVPSFRKIVFKRQVKIRAMEVTNFPIPFVGSMAISQMPIAHSAYQTSLFLEFSARGEKGRFALQHGAPGICKGMYGNSGSSDTKSPLVLVA